jgi:hypothetical protein
MIYSIQDTVVLVRTGKSREHTLTPEVIKRVRTLLFAWEKPWHRTTPLVGSFFASGMLVQAGGAAMQINEWNLSVRGLRLATRPQATAFIDSSVDRAATVSLAMSAWGRL